MKFKEFRLEEVFDADERTRADREKQRQMEQFTIEDAMQCGRVGESYGAA